MKEDTRRELIALVLDNHNELTDERVFARLVNECECTPIEAGLLMEMSDEIDREKVA